MERPPRRPGILFGYTCRVPMSAVFEALERTLR
jgi:hypothetical protein